MADRHPSVGIEVKAAPLDLVLIEIDDAPLRDLYAWARPDASRFVIRTGGLEIPMRLDETPKQALLRWKLTPALCPACGCRVAPHRPV